jgi:hypothetical protein
MASCMGVGSTGKLRSADLITTQLSDILVMDVHPSHGGPALMRETV